MSSNTQVTKGTATSALVVSQTCDDPVRVLAAVQYAGLGCRRVVLAQVATPPQDCAWNGHSHRKVARRDVGADSKKARSVWPGIWSEILSKVFLLGNIHVEDIPQIARSVGAHQVIVSSSQLAANFWEASIEQHCGNDLDIPVWTLGPGVSTMVPKSIKRILLPLSLRAGFERRLRMATQLAGATGATLAILHILSTQDRANRETSTPWTVNARLQQFFDRLSAAPCPLEISIRDGDPAEAILKFNRQHSHELVILNSGSGKGGSSPFSLLTRRVIREAHCPVLLMHAEWSEEPGSSHASAQDLSLAGWSSEFWRGAMICANPECSKHADDLIAGTLWCLELTAPPEMRTVGSEWGFPVCCVPTRFFWLCERCSRNLFPRRWTHEGLELASTVAIESHTPKVGPQSWRPEATRGAATVDETSKMSA